MFLRVLVLFALSIRGPYLFVASVYYPLSDGLFVHSIHCCFCYACYFMLCVCIYVWTGILFNLEVEWSYAEEFVILCVNSSGSKSGNLSFAVDSGVFLHTWKSPSHLSLSMWTVDVECKVNSRHFLQSMKKRSFYKNDNLPADCDILFVNVWRQFCEIKSLELTVSLFATTTHTCAMVVVVLLLLNVLVYLGDRSAKIVVCAATVKK